MDGHSWIFLPNFSEFFEYFRIFKILPKNFKYSGASFFGMGNVKISGMSQMNEYKYRVGCPEPAYWWALGTLSKAKNDLGQLNTVGVMNIINKVNILHTRHRWFKLDWFLQVRNVNGPTCVTVPNEGIARYCNLKWPLRWLAFWARVWWSILHHELLISQSRFTAECEEMSTIFEN